MKSNSEQKWLKEQVKKYKLLLPRYRQYAEELDKVLRLVVKKYAPQAIVQVRAKSISSFAEKIQRKKTEHNDSVSEFTDLCGGRVITTTPSEVEAICQFIEEHFDIDWDNSIDVSKRHKPAEFGYRSAHYIVSFKKGVFPTKDINIKIPAKVFPTKDCPMKAEIQIRSLLEHAWAVFAHDRTYKSSFKIPAKWERELAAGAAILEEVDWSFERIQAGLKTYASSYEAYMTKEKIKDEIDKLEFVLFYDPGNVALATRIGQLAITIDDWEKAIRILSKFVKSEYQPALKFLGFAMTKKYNKTPKSQKYKQGQKYLEAAITLDNNDTDAIASLAGTWKGIDEDKAGKLYRQAYEIDPVDSYSLENYLSYEIVKKKDTSIVSMMSPGLRASIQRCQEQAEVGVNIPWAFYSMGKFYLLLKKPYESLNAYARAIQLSTAISMIDTSLKSLDKLSIVEKDLSGLEWVRKLLLLGRAVKFPSDEAIKKVKNLATKGYAQIQGPVVIVAGGCDESVEKKMQSYKGMIIEAFKDFTGTIISGGTTQGISGLVGDVRQQYKDTIHTIGYLPKLVPADATVDKGPLRYKEIRYTDGNGFSPLEPLQNWIDLKSSGINPAPVKVLGINGGIIAAVEYRIALALGAKVALIEESGREAAKLLTDDEWKKSEGLVIMPADSQTVRAFIGSGQPKLEPDTREIIARTFHDHYREIHASETLCKEPSLADWDNLIESLKESNLQEADSIFEKLRQIKCNVFPVKRRKISLIKFNNKEIEIMAEMEHGRWNAERLMDGWKWGEKKDVIKKISPYLVSWSKLPEDVKEWDRKMVRKIPKILAKIGLEIRRTKRKIK